MSALQLEAFAFERSADFASWFADDHETSSELWVRIYKAGSGQPTVTWTDCVVEAIRFGWIDGLKQSADGSSYLQRLTPRRAGSPPAKQPPSSSSEIDAKALLMMLHTAGDD